LQQLRPGGGCENATVCKTAGFLTPFASAGIRKVLQLTARSLQ
jgi:hypothetical protein